MKSLDLKAVDVVDVVSVIAEALTIIREDDGEEVNDNRYELLEARRSFEEKFKDHLRNKILQIKIGQYVEYGNRTMSPEARNNLLEIINDFSYIYHKEGERFWLPLDTYVRFRYGEDRKFHISIVSIWIIEKLAEKLVRKKRLY